MWQLKWFAVLFKCPHEANSNVRIYPHYLARALHYRFERSVSMEDVNEEIQTVWGRRQINAQNKRFFAPLSIFLCPWNQPKLLETYLCPFLSSILPFAFTYTSKSTSIKAMIPLWHVLTSGCFQFGHTMPYKKYIGRAHKSSKSNVDFVEQTTKQSTLKQRRRQVP